MMEEDLELEGSNRSRRSYGRRGSSSSIDNLAAILEDEVSEGSGHSGISYQPLDFAVTQLKLGSQIRKNQQKAREEWSPEQKVSPTSSSLPTK